MPRTDSRLIKFVPTTDRHAEHRASASWEVALPRPAGAVATHPGALPLHLLDAATDGGR